MKFGCLCDKPIVDLLKDKIDFASFVKVEDEVPDFVFVDHSKVDVSPLFSGFCEDWSTKNDFFGEEVWDEEEDQDVKSIFVKCALQKSHVIAIGAASLILHRFRGGRLNFSTNRIENTKNIDWYQVYKASELKKNFDDRTPHVLAKARGTQTIRSFSGGAMAGDPAIPLGFSTLSSVRFSVSPSSDKLFVRHNLIKSKYSYRTWSDVDVEVAKYNFLGINALGFRFEPTEGNFNFFKSTITNHLFT